MRGPGVRGRLRGIGRESGEAGGGQQGGGGARACRRASGTRPRPPVQGGRRQGGCGGGLGQREELGRAGKQVSGPGGRLPFYFCSVLFFLIIVFYLFQSVLI